MQITDAKERRKRLTELYLDGEPAVKISTEIWQRSGRSVGEELDDEELHELLQESRRYLAKEKALYLLEYRPHSKKELEDKISRTMPREAAREAVCKMEELGLTDDEQYARDYARVLMGRKGFSAKRAVYELSLKGIDRETAEAVVEELEVDPTEKIREIISRKYPGIEDEKIRNRAVQALQRLGYSYGQIREALGDFEE